MNKLFGIYSESAAKLYPGKSPLTAMREYGKIESLCIITITERNEIHSAVHGQCDSANLVRY